VSHHGHHNRQSASPCRYCASTKGNANDVHSDLAPHYTSKPVLAWLQKMADSYKLERGEDLIDVISREDPNIIVGHSKDDDDDDDSDDVHDPETTNLLELAAACANTNLPMASHDFLRDPSGAIYNYGNLAFLNGFGYDWEEFVRLPSRKCVETEEEVGERQRLLDAVKDSAIASDKGGGGDMEDEGDESGEGDDGDDDDDDDLASDYDNLIRVKKDGRKILLTGVNLWNVYDICFEGEGAESPDSVRARIERGEIKAIGQAVWIRHVEYLK